MAETFNPNPTPKEALEETLHTNAGTGDIATLARALLRISEEYHRLLRSEGKTGSVFETGRKTGPVDTMPRNVTFIPPQEIENMNRSSKEHERQARWAEYWAEY